MRSNRCVDVIQAGANYGARRGGGRGHIKQSGGKWEMSLERDCGWRDPYHVLTPILNIFLGILILQ